MQYFTLVNTCLYVCVNLSVARSAVFLGWELSPLL